MVENQIRWKTFQSSLLMEIHLIHQYVALEKGKNHWPPTSDLFSSFTVQSNSNYNFNSISSISSYSPIPTYPWSSTTKSSPSFLIHFALELCDFVEIGETLLHQLLRTSVIKFGQSQILTTLPFKMYFDQYIIWQTSCHVSHKWRWRETVMQLNACDPSTWETAKGSAI